MRQKQSVMRSPVWTAVLALLLSGVIMLLALMLQKGSLLQTMEYFVQSPVLLLLNYLPGAVVLGLVYCLTGNLFYGAGASSLVWGLLSYVNLLKIEARGDPFVPGDILLLFEGIEAVSNYELRLHPAKLALLLCVSMALILTGVYVKSPRLRPVFRCAVALILMGGFAGAMGGLYMNNDLYQQLPGPDRANVPVVFEAFGFPYAFLHNFNLYPVEKPDGYAQEQASEYEQMYLQERKIPEQAPNILMVMCEAFTDLPNDDAFSYSDEENPIAFYNTLVRQDDTVSGQLVVSNTGAGTANTEFDVLTGMMTNRLGEGTTSAFRVVHRNIDSIPRMLSEAGYRTFFMHPGDSWFYNRESVYSYIGITDQVFKEPFDEGDCKGSWITDEAFVRVLTENLERRHSDAPLFTYAVTIQNHQSYNEAKYGFVPEGVQTDVSLSAEAAEILAVYFEGLRDSDAMLETLTAYLQEQEEPYLLVFFGDHQPNLGGDYQAYRELGCYPENMDDAQSRLGLYTVPFLIWGNDAFHCGQNLSDISRELGDDPIISSHYLGALTCQAAGFEGLDGYVDYLNSLRLELPVYSAYGCRTSDGVWMEELPPELGEREKLRWHWQYYRLNHQKISG